MCFLSFEQLKLYKTPNVSSNVCNGFFQFLWNTNSVSFFFFFKHKTAYEIRNCVWSSDVCSSDLSHQFLLLNFLLLGYNIILFHMLKCLVGKLGFQTLKRVMKIIKTLMVGFSLISKALVHYTST